MLMTVSSALVKYFCTGAYNQTVQEQKVAHEQLELCSFHLFTSSVIYNQIYHIDIESTCFIPYSERCPLYLCPTINHK